MKANLITYDAGVYFVITLSSSGEDVEGVEKLNKFMRLFPKHLLSKSTQGSSVSVKFIFQASDAVFQKAKNLPEIPFEFEIPADITMDDGAYCRITIIAEGETQLEWMRKFIKNSRSRLFCLGGGNGKLSATIAIRRSWGEGTSSALLEDVQRA